jgi:hypothetical protein
MLRLRELAIKASGFPYSIAIPPFIENVPLRFCPSFRGFGAL